LKRGQDVCRYQLHGDAPLEHPSDKSDLPVHLGSRQSFFNKDIGAISKCERTNTRQGRHQQLAVLDVILGVEKVLAREFRDRHVNVK
jgi:hypothetical protein